MSSSDSDLNFSDFSDSDEDSYFYDNLHENLMFYLICQESDLYKIPRKFSGIKSRERPLDFINSWSDVMFYRQFRMDREDFNNLLSLMIAGYPGSHSDGWSNYCFAKEKADRSYGHIPLELKLYITMRMLSGASYLDMIWYGVDINYVTTIFKFCVSIILQVDKQIFMPESVEDWNDLAARWSQKSVTKFGFDLMPGTVLAGKLSTYTLNQHSICS